MRLLLLLLSSVVASASFQVTTYSTSATACEVIEGYTCQCFTATPPGELLRVTVGGVVYTLASGNCTAVRERVGADVSVTQLVDGQWSAPVAVSIANPFSITTTTIPPVLPLSASLPPPYAVLVAVYNADNVSSSQAESAADAALQAAVATGYVKTYSFFSWTFQVSATNVVCTDGDGNAVQCQDQNGNPVSIPHFLYFSKAIGVSPSAYIQQVLTNCNAFQLNSFPNFYNPASSSAPIQPLVTTDVVAATGEADAIASAFLVQTDASEAPLNTATKFWVPAINAAQSPYFYSHMEFSIPLPYDPRLPGAIYPFITDTTCGSAYMYQNNRILLKDALTGPLVMGFGQYKMLNDTVECSKGGVHRNWCRDLNNTGEYPDYSHPQEVMSRMAVYVVDTSSNNNTLALVTATLAPFARRTSVVSFTAAPPSPPPRPPPPPPPPSPRPPPPPPPPPPLSFASHLCVRAQFFHGDCLPAGSA